MSQQINLYSPIFRKQTKVFSATTMLQGVALMVLVIAVFYYYVATQSALLEIRAAESSRQLKSELERLKVYGARESPADRAKAFTERKTTLEARIAAQSKALEALNAGALGRAEGYSGVLRALARVSVEGVWLTRVQFSEGAGELSLSGRALRADLVPAYLERLRGEAVLRTQGFSVLEVTRPPAKAPAPGAVPAPTFVEFALASGELKERSK
jgi:Fimbrial assembly protein (PilN)